jgi:alkylation response protein AidB-like acyl-CoA dehydrogenase
MDLQLTEEQTWLAESVAELAAREAGDDGIVPPAASEAVWARLVEFGALDDELGAVELALVARGLGERLAAVPYADTAAVRYAVGDFGRATPCLAEPGRSFAPLEPTVSIEDGRVTGEKTAVAFAGAVETLAVVAGAADGACIALVPAAGASVSSEPSLDPTLALARVRLDGVEARDVAGDAAVVERLASAAAVLAAAEAVGAAGAVLGLAREYASQRRQFGRTIGSFQAIRHLLADLLVQVESSWSSVLYAAASLDERLGDAGRTAAIAKAYTSRATLDVAHGALQVFGGIAFTAEHPAHRFLRRIAVRGALYGSARDHERSLGRDLARALEVETWRS